MTEPERMSDAICGVWIDEDEDSGQQISRYITQKLNKRIDRANLASPLQFLKDGPKNGQFIILLSKQSCKDHRFLVFLTSVLYQLHYLNLVSNVVLVIIDGKIREKHLPINLRSFRTVRAPPPHTENDLDEICEKLSEPPAPIKKTLPVGNVGIGLAWSYYYGYLALVLPGLQERLQKSQLYKENPMKVCQWFIIVIPESGTTPTSFQKVDERFTWVGPIDEGFHRARAGQQDRTYKNFFYKVQNKENKEEHYFCGEFATPIVALQKMFNDELCGMDEKEMHKQMALFKHTLMSIVNHRRNPECTGRSYLHFYEDTKEFANLADDIIGIITTRREEWHPSGSKSLSTQNTVSSETYPVLTSQDSFPSSMSSYLYFPRMAIVANESEESRPWRESIEQYCAATSGNMDPEEDAHNEDDLQCFEVKIFHSLSELTPVVANPTIVDDDPEVAAKSTREKLLIILNESSKQDVEKYANQLILQKVWFPRTTFIVDLPPESIPEWLEKSGVDYIDTRKYTAIWNRLLGSLFGTSSVAGSEDKRWMRDGTGIQYQMDRLPIGNVAEGLAWSYYYNYLCLIGPTLQDRLKATDYYKQNKMPCKILILLPRSSFSHPKLQMADPFSIENVGMLERHVVQIAGNNRNYDNEVFRIRAAGQTLYACAEYCTPVLVMYEMEAEGKAGLQPGQKDGQVYIFYQVLKRILTVPEAPAFCKNFELVYYNDESPNVEPIAEVMLTKIKENL